jgi:hypothetical protein
VAWREGRRPEACLRLSLLRGENVMTRVEFIQQAVIALIPQGYGPEKTIEAAKKLVLVVMKEAPFDDVRLCGIPDCEEILEVSMNQYVCKAHRSC